MTHYLHLIAQNLRWQLETEVKELPGEQADAVRKRLSRASGRGRISVEQAEEEVEMESGRESGSSRRRKTSFLEENFGFDIVRLAGLFVVLTVGITIPALSWYCAVPMTSMADITAIYNTFSVWALVFSVWFLGEKWEKRKVFSVLLACLGVIIVAYGGADHRKVPKPIDPVHGKPPTSDDPAEQLIRRAFSDLLSLRKREEGSETPVSSAHNPFLGDLLAFIGAVTMAAYEMAFKLIGTLPDEPKQAEMYSAVPGGRNRRSRSYIRYQDGGEHDRDSRYETEGLLRTSLSGAREGDLSGDIGTLHAESNGASQHVLGGDEDIDEAYGKKRESGDARRYSTIADRLIDQDRPDYQSITPPPEPAIRLRMTMARRTKFVCMPSLSLLPRMLLLWTKKAAKYPKSELEEDEAELVLSGATRLHRTRSHLSQSQHYPVSEADGSLDDPSSADPTALRPGGPSRRTSSYRNVKQQHDSSIPPPLPFGLHANVMTAGIGLTTFTTFWIGLIVANHLGWEPFELPHNLRTYVSIAMVVLCGIFFNAAFMILLSLWGPVLASVSCLMTTILVEIADVLLGHKLKWISVLGCTLIGAGFAVLVGGGGSIH